MYVHVDIYFCSINIDRDGQKERKKDDIICSFVD